jgi:hypothetical protein
MSIGRFAGGCVRLWRGTTSRPLEHALDGETIMVSEGLEDGLSGVVARPDLRVLVAVSLANMGSMVLSPTIGRVIILGQNDTAPEALAG